MGRNEILTRKIWPEPKILDLEENHYWAEKENINELIT
jgi:hypothetical protein